MTKENYIKFRCSDDFKNLVEQQAKERGMTVSSYIEHLIRKDVDVMRVVYNDFITDEMEKAFKEESTVYLSSDGSAWLFTDMEVFKKMDKKFQFDLDTDEREHIYNVDIEEYINNQYEEVELNYLGIHIDIVDYDELVLEVIDNNENDLCCEGWDKVIDGWIKASAMTGFAAEVEDAIVKMIDDGWDISELKEVVDSALFRRGLK